MILKNAKNIPLNQNSGTLPNMSDVLTNWFQKMKFIVISKETVNFKIVEKETPINFEGVWQPFSPQQLSQKPAGQRDWKWFTVHAHTSLDLRPDEIISYIGTRYRVMARMDWKEYGYIEYHLIEDYV